MNLGLTMSGTDRMGDRLTFSSFPENYFAATGEKVLDLDEAWYFDHNPFVIRDKSLTPDKIFNPWTEPRKQIAPWHRPIWHSIAERTLSEFGIDPRNLVLRHPRLYQFEDLAKRHRVVVHTRGGSRQGKLIMPPEVMAHVRHHYSDWQIIQVGAKTDIDFPGSYDRRGLAVWDSVKLIASAQIFIGVDSGPSWIAAAYPGTWAKKVLTHFSTEELSGALTPMASYNCDWHWYDQSFTYFNQTDHDIGFTYSFKKL